MAVVRGRGTPAGRRTPSAAFPPGSTSWTVNDRPGWSAKSVAERLGPIRRIDFREGMEFQRFTWL